MSSATIPSSDEPSKPLVLLNVHSVAKFDGSNYRQWRLQIESLLHGYGLLAYIDGTAPPSKTITSADKTVSTNPAYNTWFRQDKLLFGALAGTLTSSISPLLNRTTTTHEAWAALESSYALPSRGHIKQLRHKLKNITKGTSSISDYMTKIKTTVDDLALLGTIISDEDITDHVIDGLDASYQPVIDAINARDQPITFPALLEKLLNRELVLAQTAPAPAVSFPAVAHPTFARHNSASSSTQRSSSSSSSNPPQAPKTPFKGKCQWCSHQGHTLFYCTVFKTLHPDIQVPRYNRNPTATPPPQANPTALNQPIPSPWLLDSGASHHVTSDLENLALHLPYDGTDEIVIGDGSGLPIHNTGK